MGFFRLCGSFQSFIVHSLIDIMLLATQFFPLPTSYRRYIRKTCQHLFDLFDLFIIIRARRPAAALMYLIIYIIFTQCCTVSVLLLYSLLSGETFNFTHIHTKIRSHNFPGVKSRVTHLPLCSATSQMHVYALLNAFNRLESVCLNEHCISMNE